MTPVEKYVQKLILEQDCVIIPDFGGILSRHVKAGYDVSAGIYRPSRKRIAFNEVLKVDDGLLTYTISVHEKMTIEQARHEVRAFVVSLWKSLGEQGSAEIAGLGKFLANGEGKLIFEPEDQLNFYPDWFGFEDLKIAELSAGAAEQEAGEVPVLRLPEEEAAPVASATGKSSGFRWAAAAALAGLMGVFSFMYASSTDHIELGTLNPFEGLKKYFVAAQPEAALPKPAAVPVMEETPAAADSAGALIPVEPVETVSVGQVGAPAEAPAAAEPAAKFFIITGAYGSNKYVQIRLDELNRKGFTDAGVVIQKEKGWTMVWAAAYPTREAATEALPEVRRSVGDGVWIYEDR